MEDWFNKIDGKIDKLDARLDSIEHVQIRHDENLKNHLYRTELLEHRTEQIFKELKPIQNHVGYINGVIKFLGILGLLGGIASAILKLFSIL